MATSTSASKKDQRTTLLFVLSFTVEEKQTNFNSNNNQTHRSIRNHPLVPTRRTQGLGLERDLGDAQSGPLCLRAGTERKSDPPKATLPGLKPNRTFFLPHAAKSLRYNLFILNQKTDFKKLRHYFKITELYSKSTTYQIKMFQSIFF